ncbi:MAG: di-trans,poly-cis-decaprenylcistransferase [Cellvibrionaceae bacterium]
MGVDNSLKHIAIIMDGNNRWAKKRGLINVNGHKAGVERIRDMLTVCRDQNIQTLTLFAFSSENWNRPRREVEALMKLFHSYLTKESPQLKEEGVRLRVIGGRDRYSDKVLKAIDVAEDLTKDGNTDLVIAADYGGQWDIVQSCQKLAQKLKDGSISVGDITEKSIEENLVTQPFPPLDLMVRTGGEYRISNFLLWQSAYTELFFSDKLWPDFSQSDLLLAISEYHQRQRRFGLTGDQIKKGAPSA